MKNIINNIVFIVKRSFKMDKGLVIASIMKIPINILLPLITAYLTKMLVSLVSNKIELSSLISYILVMSVLIMILFILNNLITAKVKYDAMFIRLNFFRMVTAKNMVSDYENIENPAGQLKAQKAKNAVSSGGSSTEVLFDQLAQIFTNVIGIVIYSVIIFELNIWIIIVLFGLSLLNYTIGVEFSKWQNKNKDNWTVLDRKIEYLNREASNYKAAKDIRLFGMTVWFQDLFRQFLTQRLSWWKKEENRKLLTDGLSFTITLIRDAFAYGVLVFQISNKKIDVADFIFYFTIISQYSGWIYGFINVLVNLKITSFNISDIRDFLDLPDRFNRRLGESIPDGTPSIQFVDLSFQYPNSEKYIYDNLNFSIKKGEKLAIVGGNGAGKTTLIKLLCGLYTPSKGKICLNGINIDNFNIEEYYSLFSVVFQDIHIMPTTISKNITMNKEDTIDDKEKLNKVLMLSGLKNKVDTLPEKENTLLVRGVCETGIDLSGGEIQKLALARALYKGGKIIILDEPTAALDPIAESEIYLKYKELTQGCTSIFISHRLSSTKFCDRILFFENGKIVEEGSHDDLIRLGGKYAKMYEIQSHYYKEEGNKHA